MRNVLGALVARKDRASAASVERIVDAADSPQCIAAETRRHDRPFVAIGRLQYVATARDGREGAVDACDALGWIRREYARRDSMHMDRVDRIAQWVVVP